jgi:hypothetical protein
MWSTRELRQQRRHGWKLLVGTAVVLVSASAVTLSAAPAAFADTNPDQVALATLDDIVRGDYPAAVAPFDERMHKMLTDKALGQAWSTYQQQFGAYQSHGDPQDVPHGDITVVNVPLQMQKRPGQFRVSVHPDGTVSGLYFLREGVPVPS